jgi:hypothetical protein
MYLPKALREKSTWQHRCHSTELTAKITLTRALNDKGTGTTAGAPHSLDPSAFGNNRRGGFALADTVGLCAGRKAKESKRCRRQ